MQFQDYMKYLDLACRMTFLPRYQWNGRPADGFQYAKAWRVLLTLGTCLLTSQSFGVLVYWNQVGRRASDTATFVAELSQAAGSLMLNLVAICNTYALVTSRPQIQALFTEFDELYPSLRENGNRCKHYFETAIGLMKFEFIFYIIFDVYYNGAPLTSLMWEYLMKRKEPNYSLQLTTWYPWQVKGSPLGFGICYISIFLASFVGVGSAIIVQAIICILTYQLKLHFDALASQLLELDSRHSDANLKLSKLIEYHSRILQIGEQVNSVLSFIFLASLMCATIAICMSSVTILLLDLASALRNLNSLVAFLVYHFVICYLGTEVTIAVSLNTKLSIRGIL